MSNLGSGHPSISLPEETVGWKQQPVRMVEDTSSGGGREEKGGGDKGYALPKNKTIYVHKDVHALWPLNSITQASQCGEAYIVGSCSCGGDS